MVSAGFPNGPNDPTGPTTWGNQAESPHFPGVGCACLCGDGNRDCFVNVTDSPMSQIAGLPTQPKVCMGTSLTCVSNANCLTPTPCIQTGIVNNPPLPPSASTFDAAFCDINADGACNVVDSTITAVIGLPTNPPPPGGATVDPTGCCGYLGLDFGCVP